MRKTASSIILGIAPGAKRIGVSVFKSQELVFYAVKTFRKQNQAKSLENLRKIIEKLMEKYRVGSVALEKIVFIQQHRSVVKIVSDEMKNFLKNQNVATFEYHPNLIRQILCGLEKPTKHNTSQILSKRYSELARYFNLPRLWQKRYFAQLFDAVAVGLVCSIKCRQTESFPSKAGK